MNSWVFDRGSGRGDVKAVLGRLKRSALDLGGLVEPQMTVKPEEQTRTGRERGLLDGSFRDHSIVPAISFLTGICGAAY